MSDNNLSANIAAIECAVLRWFSTAFPELAGQLGRASVSSRELSPIGFCSNLNLPESVAALSLPKNFAYVGCAVYAPNLDSYADCILHLKDGRVDYLEICSMGKGHPAEATVFEIRELNGNLIDLRESDSL